MKRIKIIYRGSYEGKMKLQDLLDKIHDERGCFFKRGDRPGRFKKGLPQSKFKRTVGQSRFKRTSSQSKFKRTQSKFKRTFRRG